MPSAHQSTVKSWPDPTIISGDKYSGVPQKEFGSLLLFDTILAKPKSANNI